LGDQFRHLIGNTGDDHPAGAIPDQDDTGQILVFQEIGDVLDMNVEADFGASEMRAVAKAGERGSINIVATRTQQRGHFFPTPATKPSWMNKHESPFVASLRSRARRAGKRRSRKRGASSRSAEGSPARKLNR
jgi:hypothetical protein